MPLALERKLKKEYAGLSKKARDHAVYGTLNKIGAMHGSKETGKGRAMERALEKKKK